MTMWAIPRHGAYTDPLYQGMEEKGISVKSGQFSFAWVKNKVARGDIVHIHWPSYGYPDKGSIWHIALGFFKFCLLLSFIKLKGARLWWTAHNLLPHEPCRFPIVDKLGRHVVIFFSDKIFVHGEEAKAVLSQNFHRVTGKTSSLPHGHWIGYYGDLADKQQAKLALGIAAYKHVFLLFGQLKPYKNVEGLIRAFALLNREDCLLLIAGRFTDPDYQQGIVELISTQPNIRLDAGFIDDDKVPYYFASADAMCMPYTEILTSGTAMLSMSYGRPIISINKGYLRDVIIPDTGILLESIAPQHLADAMQKTIGLAWHEQKIVEHVRQFTFTDAAKTLLNAHNEQGQGIK
jgi:beta-1,4-mannosyltransferase